MKLKVVKPDGTPHEINLTEPAQIGRNSIMSEDGTLEHFFNDDGTYDGYEVYVIEEK